MSLWYVPAGQSTGCPEEASQNFPGSHSFVASVVPRRCMREKSCILWPWKFGSYYRAYPIFEETTSHNSYCSDQLLYYAPSVVGHADQLMLEVDLVGHTDLVADVSQRRDRQTCATCGGDWLPTTNFLLLPGQLSSENTRECFPLYPRSRYIP